MVPEPFASVVEVPPAALTPSSLETTSTVPPPMAMRLASRPSADSVTETVPSVTVSRLKAFTPSSPAATVRVPPSTSSQPRSASSSLSDFTPSSPASTV